MSQRITVRVSSELFEQLSEAVKAEESNVSDLIRQALLARLNGTVRVDEGLDRPQEASRVPPARRDR